MRVLKRFAQFLPRNGAQIHTSPRPCLFFELDPKGGYGDKRKPLFPTWTQVKDGWSQFKIEFGKLGQEAKSKFEDPAIPTPGVVVIKWTLRNEEDLKQWKTASDSDHSQGFSKCELTLNSIGVGQFEGTLSTEVPKDGAIKRAGYCGLRTLRAMKSFMRDSYHDWEQYTHLVIRCRGDGRTYMINLSTSGYFDQLWNDVYHYPLYTRGGPYWQYSRIPFSKFYFTSKGRIQDTQTPIPLDKVTHFGITAADKKTGQFQLELDYVGIEYDPSYHEEFAYEMYKTEKNIAKT